MIRLPSKLLLFMATCSLSLLGLYSVLTTLYDPDSVHLIFHMRHAGPRKQTWLPWSTAPKSALKADSIPENQDSILSSDQLDPDSNSQPENGPVDSRNDDDFQVSNNPAFHHPRKMIRFFKQKRTGDESPNEEALSPEKNVLDYSVRRMVVRGRVKAEGHTQTPNTRIFSDIKPFTNSSQGYLLLKTIGRLGNFMFEFATAVCAAKLNNLKLVVKDVDIWKHFRHQDSRATQELWDHLWAQPFKTHSPRTCCSYHPEVVRLQGTDSNHFLFGYFQSWKYFQPCKSQVMRAILFNSNIVQQAEKIVKYLRQKMPRRTLVGMHVRMEDYLAEPAVRSGKKVAPPEFYRRAMSYFRSRFFNVTFVVITSKMKWFKRKVTDAADVTVLRRSRSPALDMEVLSRMDHVIFSVGTFGWWIAYKNNGTVVCYKDFYVPGSEYGAQIWNDGKDFFYPGWVLL